MVDWMMVVWAIIVVVLLVDEFLVHQNMMILVSSIFLQLSVGV